MTNEQKAIAIAKLCGWSCSERGWWSHQTLPDNGGAEPKCPDYLNDLNAMHEAEQTLDYDKAYVYAEVLYDIGYAENITSENRLPHRFLTVTASATHRADAFLTVHDIE